jgi:hypothetical protein
LRGGERRISGEEIWLIREAGRRYGDEELCVFCVGEESSVKREREKERSIWSLQAEEEF